MAAELAKTAIRTVTGSQEGRENALAGQLMVLLMANMQVGKTRRELKARATQTRLVVVVTGPMVVNQGSQDKDNAMNVRIVAVPKEQTAQSVPKEQKELIAQIALNATAAQVVTTAHVKAGKTESHENLDHHVQKAAGQME